MGFFNFFLNVLYSKDEATIFQSKICTISPFLLSSWIHEQWENSNVFLKNFIASFKHLLFTVSFLLKNSQTIQFYYYIFFKLNPICFVFVLSCLVLFILFWATLDPRPRTRTIMKHHLLGGLSPKSSNPFYYHLGTAKNKQTFVLFCFEPP